MSGAAAVRAASALRLELQAGAASGKALHARLARALGGWMDALRCELRSEVEDLLPRASVMAAEVGARATCNALLALA